MVTLRNSQVKKLHLWILATTPARLSASVATVNSLSVPSDLMSLSTDSKCWSGASDWLSLVLRTESEL